MVGFVRALAPTLQQQGIALNAVCPAIVRTDIASQTDFDALLSQGFKELKPSQIADAVSSVVRSGESGKAMACVPNRAPFHVAQPEREIMGGA